MANKKIRRLTYAALSGALAFVLMYFAFSVPILSPFAEFDASALPEIIGGFILGPLGAVEIVTVKILLKLAFKGTESLLVGELQCYILSLAYVLPAVIYYRGHRTKKGAVIGLVIGSVTCIVVSIFTNIFLIFPAYIRLYGMNWDSIIAICSAVNPWIKNIPTFIAFSIVPFNVLSKGTISVITFLVYKRISGPIKKFILD